MPEYVYRAVDSNGIVIRSRITDKSKQNVVRRLKNNGMIPIYVNQTSFGRYKKKQKINQQNFEEIMKLASSTVDTQKNIRKFSIGERIRMTLTQVERVSTRDIIIFTQNFYLLKKAGFNNVHALHTLVQAVENTTLKGILEDVLAGLEAGNYMYSTMEYYSDIFPYIYINLIRVGELSGSLEQSLKQAIEYLETSDNLSKKIKKILIPNIALFITLLIVLVVGTLYLIPLIQDVFKSMGSTATLPKITIWFMDFLNGFQKVWFVPLIFIGGACVGLYFYITTPTGRYKFDYFKYKMPLFGKLMFAIDFSRLSKAMLLNLKNGMRIQESLEVSKNIIKNVVMLSMIEAAINNIIVGKAWIEPFEESGLASPMIIEMIKIGMQTDLANMMEKLVEFMEMDINNILARIVVVLPQIVYILVGALLIFITLVILVPCIQAYMGEWLFDAAGV